MRKKLRGRGGFTLTELLACLLIVAMLGVVVAAGLSTGMTLYRDAKFLSESAILTSTLNTALSDVLRFADEVECDGSGAVTAFRSRSGYGSGCSLALDSSGYLVCAAGGGETMLINRGAYSTLALSDFTLSYDEADRVFRGGYTISWQGREDLSKTIDFAFRALQ